MEQKKEHIGFPTPSREIEDAFLEIREQLSKKKVDWQFTLKQLEMLTSNTMNRLPTEKVPLDQFIMLCFSLTNLLIARLGVESIEMHGRLARVERVVKDLKLVR